MAFWRTWIYHCLRYAHTFDEHLRNLDLVLSRLELHGLTLRPSKCTLFKSEVKFLGYIASKSGVSCDPKKVACVSNWPILHSLKEVRQFLNLASYYQKFVKDFAELAAAMYNLTKNSAKQFEWTDECNDGSLCLKSILTSAPVLVYSDFSKPFIVYNDALNGAVGGVLSQIRDGKEKPGVYCSLTLTKCERNYSTTRKELLAVVYALQNFCSYLDQTFLLRTNHAALLWLWESKDVFGECARWFKLMAEFNFKLVHRSGSVHGNADALSGCPGGEENFLDNCPFRYNNG